MTNIAYCSAWINGVCNEVGKESLRQETSSESLKRLIQRIPNIVVGLETYRFILSEHIDISKCRIAILSNETSAELVEGAAIFNSPALALGHFANTAEASKLIAADSATVESFLLLGLVNELVVDLEPGLTTAPAPLFANLLKSIKLDLIGLRKVGPATMQLHYKISV
jgi:CHAT domain-containing protein